MKNTVALAWDNRVVVSPHVGELDTPRSNDVFRQLINDIQILYDVKSQAIACDLHPGYASSRWADQQDLPVIRVQHHAAHASSLAGEHPDIENWLVFSWDGVGYGSDGTLWGGEALAGRPGAWDRVASFRTFRLVGGDKAGREPWRSAAALLWEDGKKGSESIFPYNGKMDSDPFLLAHQAWKRDINTFETSAVGRLFDAAAALVLGRHVVSFEGQGPMELEHMAAVGFEAVSLPLTTDDKGVLRSDWAPLLDMLASEGLSTAQRAGIFHQSMAQALIDQALAVREIQGFDAIGLSGGVFQNRRLTESVVKLAADHGIEARLHRDIPANDGGLCFGQVIEAAALANKKEPKGNSNGR
jgi:hydrogenase maturation protein HypF